MEEAASRVGVEATHCVSSIGIDWGAWRGSVSVQKDSPGSSCSLYGAGSGEGGDSVVT